MTCKKKTVSFTARDPKTGKKVPVKFNTKIRRNKR